MRTRRLDELQADTAKRADVEAFTGATDRHPLTDITRYLNQGGAALWDLLIGARGPDYFKVTAPNIVTTGNTTNYSLPSAFYMLASIRLAGQYGFPLVPFTTQEEPMLRIPQASQQLPSHYQLRRGTDGTSTVDVLPIHMSGQILVVDYVPRFVDLVNPADAFDGVNGWEEYMVCFAARCIATKDKEWDDVRSLDADMAKLEARIQALAPKRDMHRARRVKDVRGAQGVNRLGRRWG